MFYRAENLEEILTMFSNKNDKRINAKDNGRKTVSILNPYKWEKTSVSEVSSDE